MTKRVLSDYMAVKQLFAPNNYGSDSKVATDCTTNPNIDGFDHATFVLSLGAASSDDTIDVAIQWASGGAGSNCAEIANATDAFFTQCDTDDTSTIRILELNFREAGMEAGVLGATLTVADSDAFIGLNVFLYGGNHPSSNVAQDATPKRTW